MQDLTTKHPNLIPATIAAIPDFDWDLFFEIDRVLNAELWHGPLGTVYWTEADPLEHYTWQGFEQAAKDVNELLGKLPGTLFYDTDAEWVTTDEPELDDDEWLDWVWVEFSPRDLLYKEVRQYV